MKLFVAVTCLMSFSGVFGATFYRCYWISQPSVDCSTFNADPSCGTDLVTYPNKCEFSRAHCNDDTLGLLHYGACNSLDGTTPSPGNAVNGSEIVFDFMCTSLSHMNCPVGGDKVCGSDGRPYANYCEYEKAKCTHRDLHVVDCTV
ncbi:hypothetical protein ACF0H5_003779 [Mactra antiquata]